MSFLYNDIALYTNYLKQQRKTCNLIGPNENIEEHIEDCLAPINIFAQKALSFHDSVCCVDLGTGAGLPGIPLALAIALRGIACNWLLLERRQKKAQFVKDACNILQTSAHVRKHLSLTVVNEDLQQWKPKRKIHIVTARAFKPLTKKILLQIKRIAPHATLLLYKGKRISIDEELSYVRAILSVKEIIPLIHPKHKERHLIIAQFLSE